MVAKKSIDDVKISVAFRFHVNMYHSYRDDSPGEEGIGKDIRIIKYCLDILDKYNAMGVPVRGTWDLDNYYSMEVNMRKHCPELLDRIAERVRKGYDEVEIMSYNNGLTAALTEEEFLETMGRSVTNEGGSGVKDLFGDYAPVVRPQECMMSPGLMRLYKKAGMEAISVYYSCMPFNGFSNFVPLLPTEQRYNPLWYTAPGFDEKIVVLPALNPADVYDNFGITYLVMKLRREQERMKYPCDLLVLVDMDADDDFWQGYLNVHLSFALKKKKPLVDGGLNYFIKQLNRLPYVKFDTPYEYMKSHEPAGEVSVGQDLADGSFDGFSPWSDKLENTKLWSGVDRTRLNSEYALAVSGDAKVVKDDVAKSIKNRLLTTSTTHFGLSTPVMCKPRLRQAIDKVKGTIKESESILDKALELSPPDKGVIKAVFPERYYRGDGMRQGLIRLKSEQETEFGGKGVELSFERDVFGKREVALVYRGKAKEVGLEKGKKGSAAKGGASVFVEGRSMGNKYISLSESRSGELELYYNGQRVTDNGSFLTAIKYNNDIFVASNVSRDFLIKPGKAAFMVEKGGVVIDPKKEKEVFYEKRYMIAGELPYLYVDVELFYPETDDFGTTKAKLKKLKRGYDTRWQEIMPLEIVPALRGTSQSPIRVHKHSFTGDMSYFDFDYYKFSPNKEIDASNNAVTCGFVSFAAGGDGLLLAQSVSADNNFAFSRARIRDDKGDDSLLLNPFGVYGGKQLHYIAENFGVAKSVALKFAESFMSCAPTFRGGHQQFSLMIAPYKGDRPDDGLVNDAIMHAYPPLIKSGDDGVAMIDFTDWEEFKL